MATTYIVNSNGYFFENTSEINKDILLNAGCSIFETKHDMYVHLYKKFNLVLEEVENGEIVIRDDIATCMMGYEEEIPGTVEDFIINYEL